jgi:hypothetical protein
MTSFGYDRDEPTALVAVTLAPEPPAYVWRARCLLAQSIVNQRATGDGLSKDDAAAVAGALAGVWDH